MIIMHVGTAKVVLRLPENNNLKGKRRVVQSLTTRVRAKFSVAVAEVDTIDQWQIITLGISCVSNDGRHANAQISNVVRFLESAAGEAEIVDQQVEIVDGF